MILKTNTTIQTLAGIGQIGNLSIDAFPFKVRVAIAIILAVGQAVSGVLAHFYNQDGTPSTVPFSPEPTNNQSNNVAKMLLVFAIVPSLLVPAFTACTPKQLETFKAVSGGVVATAIGINSTIDALIEQGKFSPDQAAFVKTYLSNGIHLISDVNAQIQSLQKWPPENAGQIIDVVNQAIALIDEATTQGTIKFGNDATMQRVGLTLAILKGGLGTIKSLLDGQPVKASALDDLRSDKQQLDEIWSELRSM
jgi:hypothetical protein